MIRITTRFGEQRVRTLFHDGKWITLCSDFKTMDADSLFEAGQNHLIAASRLRDKVANKT